MDYTVISAMNARDQAQVRAIAIGIGASLAVIAIHLPAALAPLVGYRMVATQEENRTLRREGALRDAELARLELAEAAEWKMAWKMLLFPSERLEKVVIENAAGDTYKVLDIVKDREKLRSIIKTSRDGAPMPNLRLVFETRSYDLNPPDRDYWPPRILDALEDRIATGY